MGVHRGTYFAEGNLAKQKTNSAPAKTLESLYHLTLVISLTEKVSQSENRQTPAYSSQDYMYLHIEGRANIQLWGKLKQHRMDRSAAEEEERISKLRRGDLDHKKWGTEEHAQHTGFIE